MNKLFLFLVLLISPAYAQSVVPNFTQGSMTSTTTTTTTVSETIVTDTYAGDYTYTSGYNVTPSGAIHAADTTWSVTTSGAEFQLEQVSRAAGIISTEEITRTIDVESVTNSLSVFSQ